MQNVRSPGTDQLPQTPQREWIEFEPFSQNGHVDAGVGESFRIRPAAGEGDYADVKFISRQAGRQQGQLFLGTGAV